MTFVSIISQLYSSLFCSQIKSISHLLVQLWHLCDPIFVFENILDKGTLSWRLERIVESLLCEQGVQPPRDISRDVLAWDTSEAMGNDPGGCLDVGESVLSSTFTNEVVPVLQSHGEDFVETLGLVDVSVDGIGNDVLGVTYCLHSEVICLSVEGMGVWERNERSAARYVCAAEA